MWEHAECPETLRIAELKGPRLGGTAREFSLAQTGSATACFGWMHPVVGTQLAGPVVADGPSVRLGVPHFGPSAFLRDLELRLGLPPRDESESVRVPAWLASMDSLGANDAFYAQSFALDPLGTAVRVLEWRDALVEGGWDGGPIEGGGPRLATLHALEQHRAEAPHRLVAIERALASASEVYDQISLLEPREAWPGRWRRIFDRLRVRQHPLSFSDCAAETDLALLQRSLRGESVTGAVRGDGSVLALRGDTPADLAELTAMLLASGPPAVVIRCRDGESLDLALPLHGLARQGHAGESAWRPALQLLALALEVAFEPRDPHRVLELLTLPGGPFRGVIGARLARAVARQPGVGGKEWLLQKAEAAARIARHELDAGSTEAAAAQVVAERMQQVTEWLEAPGAPRSGIERASLLVVVERVRAFHRARVAKSATSVAAHAQVMAFQNAVAADPRPRFSQEEVRQLFDRFGRLSQRHELSLERAGRIAHVAHPGAVLAQRPRVVFWSFVGGVERRPPRLPWNAAERAALDAAGVHLVDPSVTLAAEAAAWRRGVLAATEQVVFVVPGAIKGVPTVTHPLWDEIRARLSVDDARLERDARGVRARGMVGVALRAVSPMRLPDGRATWTVPPELLQAVPGGESTSVTALERIATCPFAWVLEHRASLRRGAMASVSSGALLDGSLAHRLVEELHAEDAFEAGEKRFLEIASAHFESLLHREGATLLLPGASVERAQLTRQMLAAMRALHRFLRESGWRITAVEEEIAVASEAGPLHGRLDLRLVDAGGASAVLDMKWGGRTYRELLRQGRAVQLAAYVHALPDRPPAGYFVCSSGEVLSNDARLRGPRVLDGPSLEQTWRRVGATARAVLAAHAGGAVHVPAARTQLPILDALGVSDAERPNFLDAPADAGCKHCSYHAICGRKWNELA